jgi:hypothetical protein
MLSQRCALSGNLHLTEASSPMGRNALQSKNAEYTYFRNAILASIVAMSSVSRVSPIETRVTHAAIHSSFQFLCIP